MIQREGTNNSCPEGPELTIIVFSQIHVMIGRVALSQRDLGVECGMVIFGVSIPTVQRDPAEGSSPGRAISQACVQIAEHLDLDSNGLQGRCSDMTWPRKRGH